MRFYGNSYKNRIASVLLRNKTKATRFEKVFFRTNRNEILLLFIGDTVARLIPDIRN